MGVILIILYLGLGYWAVGMTIYKNTVFIEYKMGSVFTHKVIIGAILGWILIPIALIKKVLTK